MFGCGCLSVICEFNLCYRGCFLGDSCISWGIFVYFMNVVLGSCVWGVYMWCGYLVKGIGWMVEGYGKNIVVVIGGSVGRGFG